MTVSDSDMPAVAVDGKPDTTSRLAAAGLTVIPESVPVMAEFRRIRCGDRLAAGGLERDRECVCSIIAGVNVKSAGNPA